MYDHFLRSFKRRKFRRPQPGEVLNSDTGNSHFDYSQGPEDIQIIEGDPGFRIRIDLPRPLADAASQIRTAWETQLIDALEEILAKQDADARKRSEDSYYGNTGKWVRFAAWDARNAIHGSLGEALKSKSLEPILLSVGRALGRFCDYYASEDVEGYGLATFGEVLRDLIALQKSLGESPNIDLDTLLLQ